MSVEPGVAANQNFEPSRDLFRELAGWLNSDEALALPLAEVEVQLMTRGQDLIRQLVQDHVDLHAKVESEPSDQVTAAGSVDLLS